MLYEKQFDKKLNESGAHRQDIVLCSTGRSGSHFLGHLMAGTKMLGVPFEYFNLKNMEEWEKIYKTKTANELLDKLRVDRVSQQSGVFSTKIHYSQLRHLGGIRFLLDNFRTAKYIFIKRKDLLKQAISMVIARQTGQWISGQKGKNVEPIYSYSAINFELKKIIKDNASWEYMFNSNGIEYHNVLFEDVVVNQDEELEKILKFIFEDKDYKIDSVKFDNKLSTKKQSSHISDEWKEKFLKESNENEEIFRYINPRLEKFLLK